MSRRCHLRYRIRWTRLPLIVRAIRFRQTRTLLALLLVFAFVCAAYFPLHDVVPTEILLPHGDLRRTRIANRSVGSLVEPQFSSGPSTLVVFVQSHPSHVVNRTVIRQSWAKLKHYTLDGHTYDIQVIFAIGIFSSNRINELVRNEGKEHSDILLLDVPDEYDNLSIKGFLALKWITTKHPRVHTVIKTDDDVTLNMFAWTRLAHTLRTATTLQCYIAGKVYMNNLAKRYGKYSVTYQEYPYAMFPTFSGGVAYLMSRQAIVNILDTAQYVPIVSREDAYFTGILAELRRIPRFKLPISLFSKQANYKVGNYLAVENFDSEHMMQSWLDIVFHEIAKTRRVVHLSTLEPGERGLEFVRLGDFLSEMPLTGNCGIQDSVSVRLNV